MDGDLTSEQQMLRSTVRRYLERACSHEELDRIDEAGVFPEEVYQGLAGIGAVGLLVPEHHGGSGASHQDLVVVCEEIGRTSGSVVQAWFTTAIFGVGSVTAFGTPEQQEAILPAVAAGRCKLSFALTEPEAGSDAGSLRTRALESDDGWVLDGSKVFITAPEVADHIIVAARSEPGTTGREAISTFLVPTSTPGITTRPIKKMGHVAVTASEVRFDGVRIPASTLMGERAAGWRNLLQVLDLERLGVAGVCVGMAAAVTDLAVEHARTRTQFGRPIGKFQAVSHMIADMATRTEAARRLTYWAAREIDRGRDASGAAAMAKACATETATAVATDGVQVFGGYGYTLEYPVQRYYREAKLYEVAGGTTQIQRSLIARSLGL